jgi:UDP-GlcNAc:undecaprenyl-phosphate GlcNAc-1-phosphate transferase
MSRDFLILLCLGIAMFTTGISYLASIVSSHLAKKYKAVDAPTGGRKIHTKSIPLWGGVGIIVSIILALVVFGSWGVFDSDHLSMRQLVGFVAGLLVLCIGGMIDDRHPLSPLVQLIFPMLAALCVILSGTGIVQITNPLHGGAFSLTWGKFGMISLPADLLTFLWLLCATYATKFLDGLDGLVSGIAVIGSGMVGALTMSPVFYQPAVAVLSTIVGGSFLGFLPSNVHPAKQFLGESGSTVAGFCLGFLAIVSSAKIALALAVLAIPVADAVIVLLGRVARGVPPWKGDDTHLHFRLLKAGIPHRSAVLVLWAVSFAAGIMALSLQTRGRIFLVVLLALLTVLTSWLAKRVALRK